MLANWKTTATGALMVVTAVASMFGIGPHMDPGAAMASIMGGIGLITAKDAQ